MKFGVLSIFLIDFKTKFACLDILSVWAKIPTKSKLRFLNITLGGGMKISSQIMKPSKVL